MICIAGKNDIAANVLSFVVSYFGIDNVIAIANKDDVGYATWQQSLTATAQRLGVKLASLKDVYDIPNLYFFSVEFDKIIVPSKFKDANLINIHFSLLPKFKGVFTAVWPILLGETHTGVTLHFIEAGIDTGPIIYQHSFEIHLHDNARDVYYNCLSLGYKVLCDFIPRIVNFNISSVTQSIIGSSYYGSNSIDYNSLQINLRQTAYQIHNAVRAFSFQEYQLPIVLERRVRYSKLTNITSTCKPGCITEENDDWFVLSTIDYDLILYKDYTLYLFQAIQENNYSETCHALQFSPDLNVCNRQGWTPLMIAAFNGNIHIVKALLDAGANVNAVNKNNTSVLMYAKSNAVKSNNTELMELLLNNKANINAIDIHGKTALDYAVKEGSQKIIDFLQFHS